MTRVVPRIKHASCPYDEKILPFYDGVFDAVYIIFHPFFRPTSKDFLESDLGNWPSKQEFLNNCEAVSWEHVLKIASFNSFAEIDVGLRTGINGLGSNFENLEFAGRLSRLYEKSGLAEPIEGVLSPFVENRLLNAIKKLGAREVAVSDEWGQGRMVRSIDEVISGDFLPVSGCINAFENKLLITTHWDSHFAFLCSSKSLIDRILCIEPFEGFFCSEETEVYWSVYDLAQC